MILMLIQRRELSQKEFIDKRSKIYVSVVIKGIGQTNLRPTEILTSVDDLYDIDECQ